MKIKIVIIVLFACISLRYTFVAQHSSPINSIEGVNNLESIKDKTIRNELKPLLYNYSHDSLSSDLLSIPILETNEFYSTIIGEGIEITIHGESFIPAEHSIATNYDSLNQVHGLKEIDGKAFWGTHGTIPKTKVSAIDVKINGTVISFPDSATDGIYNPNFGCNDIDCFNFVYKSKDKERVYIKMDNSDASGFYQVVWIIKDEKYIGRVIDPGP